MLRPRSGTTPPLDTPEREPDTPGSHYISAVPKTHAPGENEESTASDAYFSGRRSMSLGEEYTDAGQVHGLGLAGRRGEKPLSLSGAGIGAGTAPAGGWKGRPRNLRLGG